MLDQPLPDFYRGYQVKAGANAPKVTVPINDHIDYDGGIVTWIDDVNGDRPYGNDLDPTLNLDVLEVCFRNLARWKILETPRASRCCAASSASRRTLRQRRLRRSALAYLLTCRSSICAYFGRCYAAFAALPPAARPGDRPDGAFGFIRAARAGLCAGRR